MKKIIFVCIFGCASILSFSQELDSIFYDYDSIYEIDLEAVTALGIKREKKSLGYATQKLEGEALQKVKGVDVSTSLTGKISGLVVKNSSEFFKEPDVTLRGETPLIIIDGVPYGNLTLRDISADDIDDINVLKGATASALYGERGGSGAIMITTKKGSDKDGLSINLNSSLMFEAGYLAIPEMQSKYGRVVKTATNTYVTNAKGSWGPPLEGQTVNQWDPISKSIQPMPFLPVGKDNFKNFLETGYILNNSLSLSQKGDLGSIRASFSHMRNKGSYPNSKFTKTSYTLGGEITYNKLHLSSSISLNVHNSPNIGFNGYKGYDPMYSLLVWGSPDWDITKYKDYWLTEDVSQNNSYTSAINNPYFERNERIHEYRKNIVNAFVSLDYDFNDNISLIFRNGYDNYNNEQKVRISIGSLQGGGTSTVLNGGSQIWGESRKGSFNTGLGKGYSFNSDAILKGNYEISNLEIDALFGGSIFYKEDDGIEGRTQGGLSLPGFYSLNASVDPAKISSVISKKQTNSIFGKIGFNWDNYFFIEATGRNDWASTLPTETRSFFYPSISGSLVLSEWVKPEFLSFWKLRGSWAVYKTPANIYAINKVYNIDNDAWNGLTSATLPNRIRPTNIIPEKAENFEIGSYASFFRDRIKLDFSYYEKLMSDFIVNASITPASGYSGVYTNSDEERTRKGFEITLDVNPIKSRNTKWDIAFNWTKYATYYTTLDDEYTLDKDWINVGDRVDHYIYKDYARDNEGNIVMENGRPSFSKIYTLAGYSNPDWVWGINSNIKYKNFDFSFSLDGRVGGLSESLTEMYMWISGNHPNSLTEERYLDATNPGTKNYLADGVKVVSGKIVYDADDNIVSDDRVFAPNDVYTTYEAYVKRLHKGNAWGGSPAPSDLYDTTFLKLREVSISYNFDDKFNKYLRLNNLSISLIGQNLIYWAKDFEYSDIDGGSENFADPSLRYIGININANF